MNVLGKAGGVMVDLETWSTKANAAIVSVGAVEFSAGGLGHEFYTRVNPLSNELAGRDFDADTQAWWDKQSASARAVFDGIDDAPPLENVLRQFSAWFPQGATLWGNGSDFDNTILTSAYAAFGIEPPWKFWDNRCYRTLKGLRPDLKLSRSGTYHNALDDAKTQAAHAVQLLKALRVR